MTDGMQDSAALARDVSSDSNRPSGKTGFLYLNDDRLGPARGFLYGFQHLLLMLPVSVLAPILLADGLKLDGKMTALLISATLIAAGVATIFQGTGPFGFGAKLPVVQGTDLLFIPPFIAVGLQDGLGSVSFVVILGGAVIAIGGRLFKYVAWLFPPLVIGTFILLVSIYLLPIAISQFVGHGTAGVGSAATIVTGLVTFVAILVFSLVLKGFAGSLAVLGGMAIGYLLALILGLVNFAGVADASWVGLPRILPLGFHVPAIGSIILAVILYILGSIETAGYVSATAVLVGGGDSPQRVGRGLMVDGAGSMLSGLLGSTPQTAYAQNLGAIGITRVGSRYISIYAGIIMIVMGLVPKISASIGTLPAPVVGGSLLVLFGTLAIYGLQHLRNELTSRKREIVFATSFSIGVGLTFVPADGLSSFPDNIKVLLEVGPAIGAIVAIVLCATMRVGRKGQSDPVQQVPSD